ncbi:Type 6 nonspecific lipid transfer protein LTP602 [Cocos nucifera]|uniref:Type 6 nonspecific lipid transfer protein LTP602 n=1 Tax=Cocos nucifera TaxID=13894 RepID=A0A8K0HZ42_COCNU|nr:Type 6 nonspecific lipid transfer protein LTP602 [Cocos nucifera]
MEGKPRSVALALAVVLVVATTMEMGLASGAQGICNMTKDELMACKPCISSVNPVDKPADACCTALAHADLPCLCAYKNSGMLPYLGINASLAMQLPAKCSVPAPAQCK